MEVFEAMGTARSMRWLKPDPIPEDLIDKLMWAATRASNPNNIQAWDFVVVTAPKVIGELASAVAWGADVVRAMPDPGTKSGRATLAGAANLIGTFARLPMILFVCGRNVFPTPEQPDIAMMYSSMFSAAQNLVIAARALGLGAAYTSIHRYNEPKVREILAIPDDRHIGVTMPFGYPERDFGPVRRRPLDEVVHRDQW